MTKISQITETLSGLQIIAENDVKNLCQSYYYGGMRISTRVPNGAVPKIEILDDGKWSEASYDDLPLEVQEFATDLIVLSDLLGHFEYEYVQEHGKADAAMGYLLTQASDEEFEDNEEKLGEAYDHLKNALECLSHFPFLGDESAKIKQVIQRLEKLAGAD